MSPSNKLHKLELEGSLEYNLLSSMVFVGSPLHI